MRAFSICTILLFLLVVYPARAGEVLFDFEGDAQVAAWRIRSAGQDTLVRSPKFASSGASSLLFKTPAWKEGLNQWPAFDAKPPVADWRPYDRLVVDLTNPNAERHFLSLLEQCAAALRKAFPEVLLLTSSYDHSLGLDSVVKSIDAWCPLTPRFDVDKVAQARAAGKQVWWYICCGPHNPHANWFVEYAAIESRLLMGAMTAKYRPDGFLYYSLSIWNDNKPIESGPFTDWNPVSWTTYHGDGSLLCSGPGGKPLPTVRLENYRDGMEDLAYVCILQEIVRHQEAKRAELSAAQRQWLAEATAALAVPETLVKAMSEYSHDPKVLYAYRDKLGDLIDRSGIAEADPWGDNFGVRGFRRQR